MDESRPFVAQLMDEALDAELDFGLLLSEDWAEHIPGPDGSEQVGWRELRSLHLALRAHAPPEMPPHFTNRTMASIEANERGRMAWQVTLLRLGAIIAGLTTALGAIGLLWGAGLWRAPRPVFTDALVQSMRSLWSAAAAVGASVAESPWVLVLYALIAGSIAAFWFLALVWPRLILRTGRGKSIG